MLSDDDILALPEMVALVEQAKDDGLPVLESQLVEAWRMGYAYLWHMLPWHEKRAVGGA